MARRGCSRRHPRRFRGGGTANYSQPRRLLATGDEQTHPASQHDDQNCLDIDPSFLYLEQNVCEAVTYRRWGPQSRSYPSSLIPHPSSLIPKPVKHAGRRSQTHNPKNSKPNAKLGTRRARGVHISTFERPTGPLLIADDVSGRQVSKQAKETHKPGHNSPPNTKP